MYETRSVVGRSAALGQSRFVFIFMATSQVNAGDLVLGWEPIVLVEIWRYTRASDLLLLKLISGELDVSKLEIETAATI